jgi:hypothetical protein
MPDALSMKRVSISVGLPREIDSIRLTRVPVDRPSIERMFTSRWSTVSEEVR